MLPQCAHFIVENALPTQILYTHLKVITILVTLTLLIPPPPLLTDNDRKENNELLYFIAAFVQERNTLK